MAISTQFPSTFFNTYTRTYELRDYYLIDSNPLASSGATPGPGSRSITGSLLFTRDSRLLGGSTLASSPSWGDSKIIYTGISRTAGRTLTWLITPEGRHADFYAGLSLNNTLSSEPSAGIGWQNEEGALRVLTPNGDLGLSPGIGNIRPMQYLLVVTLNDTGGVIMLSTFGTDSSDDGMSDIIGIPQYPSARIVYVQRGDQTTTLYPFASFYDNDTSGAREGNDGHYFEDLRVRDISDWSSNDALSSFADRFTRADNSSSIGNSWSTDYATWGISSNQAYVASGDGSINNPVAWYDAGASDGIFTYTITIPASGNHNPLCILRRSAPNNFIALRTNFGNTWSLQYWNGVDPHPDETIGSSSFTWIAGQTYNIAIHAYGNKYLVFIDDQAVQSDWLTDSNSNNTNATGIGVGVGVGTGNATAHRFDNIAVYPHTVTLPNELQQGAVPRVLSPGATLGSDSFTDTTGTALSVHTADSGGAWTEYSGTWTVNASGRAMVSGSNSVLVSQNLSTSDVECSIDLIQPASVGQFVFAGILIRYVDDNNWFVVREAADTVGQPTSHEIELLQCISGTTEVVRKVQMDVIYTNGAVHTLKVHIKNDLLQVFLNDRPRISHILPDEIAAGTQFGLYRDASTDSGVTFDNWLAKSL